ncbi:hypothetical protein HAX54_008212 [Datura stramonium]|uniref:F-box protein At3g26010-like beta-propeller domain-containing protein n=1 Tax=Datura stramonium TaxID=4076 RepID=A0ABS8TFF5_DATST|nr:hypothetical protein [Datura stramonium]
MRAVYPGDCCLGLSGGKLCFASIDWTTIICWQLSNFPSRDAVWVRKYVLDVATVVQKCQEDFGLGGRSALDVEVRNMVFHPALPHILYLQIRGKNLCMILEMLGGRRNATNCFPMSGLNGRVFYRLSINRLFVPEEIVINILNRLPWKSLARFICISENWRKYIAEIYRGRLQLPEPYLIGFFCVEKRFQSRFFFSSKESPLLIGTSLDKSVNFIGERVYVVASSNGFLLCNKLRSRQRIYYVYNPTTRQRLDVPKTRILMKDPYVGFIVLKETDESVSFTIVRYVIPPPIYWDKFHFQYSLTIESFSSHTNVWTANKLIVDVPMHLYPSRDMTSSSSAAVVNGLFCWLNYGSMAIYDSVNKCFWVLELPEQTRAVYPGDCCLGLSGGELCFASIDWTTIICWQLSNFPSRDAVWVRKYVLDVATVVQKCQENFGLGGRSALDVEVRNMVFHPALPHILYLQIRGKVISYDLKTATAQLVYDFGDAWRKTQHYKLFSYEWPQWPRLL